MHTIVASAKPILSSTKPTLTSSKYFLGRTSFGTWIFMPVNQRYLFPDSNEWKPKEREIIYEDPWRIIFRCGLGMTSNLKELCEKVVNEPEMKYCYKVHWSVKSEYLEYVASLIWYFTQIDPLFYNSLYDYKCMNVFQLGEKKVQKYHSDGIPTIVMYVSLFDGALDKVVEICRNILSELPEDVWNGYHPEFNCQLVSTESPLFYTGWDRTAKKDVLNGEKSIDLKHLLDDDMVLLKGQSGVSPHLLKMIQEFQQPIPVKKRRKRNGSRRRKNKKQIE
jgi:hypothetical protein